MRQERQADSTFKAETAGGAGPTVGKSKSHDGGRLGPETLSRRLPAHPHLVAAGPRGEQTTANRAKKVTQQDGGGGPGAVIWSALIGGNCPLAPDGLSNCCKSCGLWWVIF